MTVCRYFLEGRCRFGNRCYNEHVDPGYSQRPHYDSGNKTSRYSNYNDTRYPTQNAYSRSYGDNSFNDHNPYQWRSSRYDSRYSGTSHSQSRYETRQPSPSPPRSGFDRNEYSGGMHRPSQYETHQSASPPLKSRFDGNSVLNEPQHKTDEEALLNCIREDIDSWVKGSIWPFSCYSPQREIGCVPGFNDISPEELRYEAHQALKENTFPDYEKRIANALVIIKRKQEILSKDPQLAFSHIKNHSKQEEENMQFDQILGNTNQDQTKNQLFGKPISAPSSANIFNLNHLSSGQQEIGEMESMNEDFVPIKMNKPESSFRFVLPSEDDKRASTSLSQPVSIEPEEMYTRIEELTQDELDAFSAPTFTLGTIPTKPPPKTFCF